MEKLMEETKANGLPMECFQWKMECTSSDGG